MIEEIVNIHFTNIKDVFQPVFDRMTKEAKKEMFLIFGEGEITEKELEMKLVEAAKDSYDEGYDEGYNAGMMEGEYG